VVGNRTVCVGNEWDYTFNVRAPDGSNTAHIMTATGGAIASVDQIDNASQTIRGHGLMASPPAQAVQVTGYVEAVNQNIPFMATISVTVMARGTPRCPARPPAG
jgi:hypothetical protein